MQTMLLPTLAQRKSQVKRRKLSDRDKSFILSFNRSAAVVTSLQLHLIRNKMNDDRKGKCGILIAPSGLIMITDVLCITVPLAEH